MSPEKRYDDNRGLVYHIARRYKVPAEDYDDMIQEGQLALWRACLRYDETKGRFTSYAGRAIEHAFGSYTSKAWNNSGLSACSNTLVQAYKTGDDKYINLNRPALSTEYYEGRDDDDGATIGELLSVEDTYDDLYGDDLRRVVSDVMNTEFDHTTRAIVSDRFGLGGDEPMTYEELGARYGFNRQRAWQRIDAALNRLRVSDAAATLSDFLS